MELIIFSLMALTMIGGAVMVITQRFVVNSVLYLILVLVCQAILFVILGAQFLAVMQVIVYAGAIMVLFVFVLMLLNLSKKTDWEFNNKIRLVIGFVVAGLVFISAIAAIKFAPEATAELNKEMGSPANVGKELFVRYLLPFELASVMLLAAIIGVVAMLKQSKQETETGVSK